MKIQVGQIVENRLQNQAKSVVVCRVVEFIESVQMWRVTDARETRPDAWLIANDRTWAVPVENIGPHDIDCVVCHKDGLVRIGG